MCLFKYGHSARVCIFLTAFEGLVQILLKPHQPTPLTRADSEHLAIDERSQLRQGSSPRNSFHFEHRPEIIPQTKESIAHQRKQTEFRISTAGH